MFKKLTQMSLVNLINLIILLKNKISTTNKTKKKRFFVKDINECLSIL
jgi:hypothetical protein